MALPYAIRPAEVRDAESIVAVTLSGFDPSRHSLLIYGCAGADRFVREQIELDQSDTVYTVATDGERVVGTAEIRRLDAALVLNYISILPELQGKGLGRYLLLSAIDQARSERHERMLLDVFTDNTAAGHWYRKLGFAEERRAEWLEMPLPRSAGGTEAVVSGYPQARACHQAYGFSQLAVRTGNSAYQVGMLGSLWFRLTDAEALADAELLGALAVLDQNRRILAITPEGTGERHPGVRRILTSARMSMELGELVRRLMG